MFRIMLGAVLAIALLGALPYVIVGVCALAFVQLALTPRRRAPRYIVVGTTTYGRKGRGR